MFALNLLEYGWHHESIVPVFCNRMSGFFYFL